MTGDGVRTMNSMGLGQALVDVSQEHQNLKFHLDNFKNPAYLRFPQDTDLLDQTLPTVRFMAQPRLEKALRDAIAESKYCELRVGCEVQDREELSDGVIVHYTESPQHVKTDQSKHPPQQLRAQWLVGADGKKGIVRKRFLEPNGITQHVGKYEYTGTWIAANLQISLPTPGTHPKLPVWSLGMTPEQVYDRFWPPDWHFCTHPKEAVASGRFGPAPARFWRHEFELESSWQPGMDAHKMFWQNLTPSITHDASSLPGLSETMTYPLDCIKVLRCRPFTFVQKVAGPKWHYNRTIIIGDAAHVFPPFGGQGIASGVRDAVGLSWRMAILIKSHMRTAAKSPSGSDAAEKLLGNWFHERRKGVDDSVEITMTNGRLTNQKWRAVAYLTAVVCGMMCKSPWLLAIIARNVFRDDLGYKGVEEGFFCSELGGGGKVSQIFVRDGMGSVDRSDCIMSRRGALMTVLVVAHGVETVNRVAAARKVVEAMQMDPLIVSDGSVCVFDQHGMYEAEEVERYTPCTTEDLEKHGIVPFSGYDHTTFMRRFGGAGTAFVVVRPDTIVFSLCRSVQDLEVSLRKMKEMVE